MINATARDVETIHCEYRDRETFPEYKYLLRDADHPHIGFGCLNLPDSPVQFGFVFSRQVDPQYAYPALLRYKQVEDLWAKVYPDKMQDMMRVLSDLRLLRYMYITDRHYFEDDIQRLHQRGYMLTVWVDIIRTESTSLTLRENMVALLGGDFNGDRGNLNQNHPVVPGVIVDTVRMTINSYVNIPFTINLDTRRVQICPSYLHKHYMGMCNEYAEYYQ